MLLETVKKFEELEIEEMYFEYQQGAGYLSSILMLILWIQPFADLFISCWLICNRNFFWKKVSQMPQFRLWNCLVYWWSVVWITGFVDYLKTHGLIAMKIYGCIAHGLEVYFSCVLLVTWIQSWVRDPTKGFIQQCDSSRK